MASFQTITQGKGLCHFKILAGSYVDTLNLSARLLDKVWMPSAVKPRTDGIPDDRYGKRRRIAIQAQRGSTWAQ